MMWLLLTAVYVLLCSASSFQDRFLDTELPVYSTNCSRIITSEIDGYFLLEFGQNCRVYEVIIPSENETSILSLKASILKLQNTTDSYPDESAPTERSIDVNIYEHTLHQGIKYAKLLAKWKFLDTTLTDFSYLSRTSSVKIHVTPLGNWSDYQLIFSYEEIKYSFHQKNDSNDCGVITSLDYFEGRYRPNTVFLYRLKGSSNWTSTLITIEEVDIDVSAGEYFIIGAGTTPFKGPPPLLISQPKRNSSYYIDDGNAYVMFISSSTQKQRAGFKIRWEHTGEKSDIDDSIVEDPFDALKSRLICFENASLALQEFENPCADEVMKDFRKRFVETVKRYAEEKKIRDKEIFQNLNATSIFLYPTTKRPAKYFLPATIQVKYQVHNHRISLLSWKQLGEVITKYEEEDEHHTVLGYKVGHCPPSYAYTRGTWNYLIYLSVPAFATFFLFVWAWRQKVFETNCYPPKEHEDTKSNLLAVEQNFYVETAPKIVEINEEGRRRTLVAPEPITANREERNTGEIHMTDMTTVPTTKESGCGANLSLPRIKRRSSLPFAIGGEHLHTKNIEKNESEHLYDSVSSGNSTKETKL